MLIRFDFQSLEINGQNLTINDVRFLSIYIETHCFNNEDVSNSLKNCIRSYLMQIQEHQFLLVTPNILSDWNDQNPQVLDTVLFTTRDEGLIPLIGRFEGQDYFERIFEILIQNVEYFLENKENNFQQVALNLSQSEKKPLEDITNNLNL